MQSLKDKYKNKNLKSNIKNLLIILTISIINLKRTSTRTLNKTLLNLNEISPIFIKVETSPTPNETLIKFQILENYKSSYSYRLYISELNKETYLSDTNKYKNWLYTNEDYDSFLENENDKWNSWAIKLETNQRIIKLSDLKESNFNKLFNNLIAFINSSTKFLINIPSLNSVK